MSVRELEDIVWLRADKYVATQSSFAKDGAEMTFHQEPRQPDHSIAKIINVVGFVSSNYLVTSNQYEVVYLNGQKLTGGEQYIYFDPSPSLLIPLPSRYAVVKPAGVGKSHTFVSDYSDYRLERLPAERLRLSHYGLPNELTEDDAADLTLVWALLAAGGCAVSAIVLRRRLHRHKRNL